MKNKMIDTLRGAWRPISVGAGVVVVLLVAWYALSGGSDDGAGSRWAAVERGSMEITVTGPGRIRARDAVMVSVPDDVDGQLQLLYLIPEGTVVEKGQVIAQLDTTSAAEGLESRIEQLDTAQEAYDQLLVDNENSTRSQENSVRSAELSYQQAELQIKNLEFSSELEKQQGQLNLEKARISLDEAKRKLEAQKVIDEAERQQQLIQLEGRRRDVQEARDALASLTIRAPGPGLVIHATQGRFNEITKVVEGDQVNRRQRLIELPDLSVLQAAVTINELDAERIRTGQPARVRLDAYPRDVFEAHVSEISTLAQEIADQGNVKVFPAVVTLEGSDPRVRPGMSASAEIVVDRVEEVAQVPLAAIVMVGGKPFVKPFSGGEPKEVVLGLKNESVAQVLDGLQVGERVELNWALDPTAVLASLSGRLKMPDAVAQQILAEGDAYGRATIPSVTTPEAPPQGEGRRGRMAPDEGGMPPGDAAGAQTAEAGAPAGERMGGRGGRGGFDPSTLSPEQIEAMRARFAQSGQGDAAAGGRRGGFAVSDSARVAVLLSRNAERAQALPEALKTELDAYVKNGSKDYQGLSQALRDSLDAWRGPMRRRPPPDSGTIPPSGPAGTEALESEGVQL